MSLITCPECNKQISDKADSCPSCGYPIAHKKEISEKKFNHFPQKEQKQDLHKDNKKNLTIKCFKCKKTFSIEQIMRDKVINCEYCNQRLHIPEITKEIEVVEAIGETEEIKKKQIKTLSRWSLILGIANWISAITFIIAIIPSLIISHIAYSKVKKAENTTDMWKILIGLVLTYSILTITILNFLVPRNEKPLIDQPQTRQFSFFDEKPLIDQLKTGLTSIFPEVFCDKYVIKFFGKIISDFGRKQLHVEIVEPSGNDMSIVWFTEAITNVKAYIENGKIVINFNFDVNPVSSCMSVGMLVSLYDSCGNRLKWFTSPDYYTGNSFWAKSNENLRESLSDIKKVVLIKSTNNCISFSISKIFLKETSSVKIAFYVPEKKAYYELLYNLGIIQKLNK